MNLKSRLKALEKALADRAIRSASILAPIALTILTAWLCPATAGVPLCWERVPNRPAPAQFDAFRGETLDFRCTFTGFGPLPFEGTGDVRLWYQTNGMGAAWWSVPATDDHALYAQWSRDAVTVTVYLMPCGGTVEPGSVAAASGQPYGILPAPTRDGYDFSGWHTGSLGGDLVTADTIVGRTCIHWLYAQWKRRPPPSGGAAGLMIDPTT